MNPYIALFQRCYSQAPALVVLICCAALLLPPQRVAAEGSGDLYPEGLGGSRASLEWRSSTYSMQVFRRTLLKVYARAGEYLLLGSSAVASGGAPDLGDILVYAPGAVTGLVGREVLADPPLFSCLDQRAASASAAQGRIGSRAQELAGPDTLADPDAATPGGAVPDGYVPCFYRAQQDGIYNVVMYGPAGPGQDSETAPNGSLTAPYVNQLQDTSVSMWDVTVRPSLSATEARQGRLFSYYLTMFTGGNGRPVRSTVYLATPDGYRYEIELRGMDPNGYVLYGNQLGFLDTDGTPLYRDVLAVPTLSTQQQNQLIELQGGVALAPPSYPIFFNPPASETLTALGIPLAPMLPEISDFRFVGPSGLPVSEVGQGGEFQFRSNVDGVFQIVLSRDGRDFDPTNPRNRVLRGVRGLADPAQVSSVAWNGRANDGEHFPPAERYLARVSIHGGESHFPFLDVENSTGGSPRFHLLNPPGGVCPPLEGGCSGGVYDDRGYRTADGVVVGVEVNGALCANNAGNPPDPLFSDPERGFDTQSPQRSFGFTQEGNPSSVCLASGGFGDKKGLDLWTYYPSRAYTTPLQIIERPTAVELTSLMAVHEGRLITLHWTTAAEINTWGFHILRSLDGVRAGAVRVTPTMIFARGRGAGDSYHWTDPTPPPGGRATYWLQEVERSGAINEYGPLRVGPRPANAPARLFLPLLGR